MSTAESGFSAGSAVAAAADDQPQLPAFTISPPKCHRHNYCLSVRKRSDSSSVSYCSIVAAAWHSCYDSFQNRKSEEKARIYWITGNISEECCDRMAPRTSGSNLGRSFVQAEEKISEEAEKEMEYNEAKGEGKNVLRHTLEAMSLNKSQVNISFSDHIK